MRKHHVGKIRQAGVGRVLAPGFEQLDGLVQRVPAVGGAGLAQVNHLDAIAFLCKQAAGAVVQFSLGVGDDDRFSAAGENLHHGHGEQSALFAAGGAHNQTVGIVAVYIGHPAIAQKRQAGGGVFFVFKVDADQSLFQLTPVRPAGAGSLGGLITVAVRVVISHLSPPNPMRRTVPCDTESCSR